MAIERRTLILSMLAEQAATAPVLTALCSVVCETTGVDGAAIAARVGQASQATLGASDADARSLLRTQLELGEGPLLDAAATLRPALAADLSVGPWVALVGATSGTPVRGVFAFPVQLGHELLGVLQLHRRTVRDLGADEHAVALVLADVAAAALLEQLAGAPIDRALADMEAVTTLDDVVHQATGVVSARLDVPVAAAFVRLRASAFARGLPLAEVARLVVSGAVRLDDPPPGCGPLSR